MNKKYYYFKQHDTESSREFEERINNFLQAKEGCMIWYTLEKDSIIFVVEEGEEIRIRRSVTVTGFKY